MFFDMLQNICVKRERERESEREDRERDVSISLSLLPLKEEFSLYQKLLILVKCYDNKVVKATPHLFHPFVDSALCGKPTKKIIKEGGNKLIREDHIKKKINDTKFYIRSC